MIKRYIDAELTINCGNCKQDYGCLLGPDFLFEWDEEFGCFSPVGFPCPHCEAQGVGVAYYVNPNIPEGEFDEFEEEAIGEIELGDIDARKYLRDLLWSHRPDLKQLDRAAYNQERAHLVQDVLQKYRGSDKIKF